MKHTISQNSVRSIRGNTLRRLNSILGRLIVFSASKDAEIDLTVLRVESEIVQEDFDRKQKERKQENPQQTPQYKSPIVRRDDDEDAW